MFSDEKSFAITSGNVNPSGCVTAGRGECVR